MGNQWEIQAFLVWLLKEVQEPIWPPLLSFHSVPHYWEICDEDEEAE